MSVCHVELLSDCLGKFLLKFTFVITGRSIMIKMKSRNCNHCVWCKLIQGNSETTGSVIIMIIKNNAVTSLSECCIQPHIQINMIVHLQSAPLRHKSLQQKICASSTGMFYKISISMIFIQLAVCNNPLIQAITVLLRSSVF